MRIFLKFSLCTSNEITIFEKSLNIEECFLKKTFLKKYFYRKLKKKSVKDTVLFI